MDSKKYLLRTPDFIAAFKTNKVELNENDHLGHGELTNLCFELGCNCGNSYGQIEAYFLDELILSPINFICINCNESNLLIDTDLYGYDAEIGFSCNIRAEGEKGLFKCPTCHHDEIKPKIALEYPDDLVDGFIEDYQGKEQNLFSWFSLSGTCKNCNAEFSITDFECA